MNAATRQGFDINELRREMALLNLDPSFSRILNNKKVIIVGPAETTLGTRQGEIIDSHDVVVRFNTAIQYMPFTSDLARDIGTRTDVLYCNNDVLMDGIFHQKRISHERFKEVCAVAGIKHLISTNNDFTFPAHDEPEPKSHAEYRAFKLFLQQQNINIEFRMLYSTSVIVRKLLDGYVGRTGFLGIVDLLAYDIRQLTITGMTFYHKGGHLFLEDCVSELHPMKNHQGREPLGNVKGHNSYLELELMRKLVVLHGAKLKIDEQVQMLIDARGPRE